MTRRVAAAAAIVALGAMAYPGAQATPPPGNGITWPKVVHQVRPTYNETALRARLQGIVAVDAVVLPDGSVADVQVRKSLDTEFGLDERAVAAARQWRFEPCTLEATGAPVACRITIELDFRLHDESPSGRTITPRGGAVEPEANQAGDAFAPQGSLEEFEAGAYREGTVGVAAPQVRREVRPRYTAEAMRRQVQGTVAVDVVVNPDGRVARARLAGSLDPEYGLDQEALAAARQWQFEPGTGTLNGVAVPVIVRLRLEFRLP